MTKGKSDSYRDTGLSGLPNDFDLSAAWFRRAQSDLKAFMEAFAVRLEGAVPARVRVERQKDSLFSKTRHVTKINVEAQNHIYALTLQGGRLSAERSKVVRGVSLMTEHMDVPQWLDALREDIQALAEHAGSAQDVLHDFLMS